MHITQKKKIDQAHALAVAIKNADDALSKLKNLLASLGVEITGEKGSVAEITSMIDLSQTMMEKLTREAGEEALEERMSQPMEYGPREVEA